MTTTRRQFLGLLAASPLALLVRPTERMVTASSITFHSRWENRGGNECLVGFGVEAIVSPSTEPLMIGRTYGFYPSVKSRFELENWWTTASGQTVLCGRVV